MHQKHSNGGCEPMLTDAALCSKVHFAENTGKPSNRKSISV
jgi:hypothetical protein